MNKGLTIWFSGLSGSGKSTTALELEKLIRERGYRQIEVLDGDEIREELNWDLGFSREDRITNLKRVTYTAKILSRNSVIVIAAFISPYQQNRDYAREHNENFFEVYIKCPLEICEKRDAKGLYKKARAGEIKLFTGIDDPFDEPKTPDIVVETDNCTPEDCARQIIDKAVEIGYLE